jgi:hypothetical protein
MSGGNLRVAPFAITAGLPGLHRIVIEFGETIWLQTMGRDGHHGSTNSVIDPFNTVCFCAPGLGLGCRRPCRHRARRRLSDCSGFVGVAEWPLVLSHRSDNAAEVLVPARRQRRVARTRYENCAIRGSGGAFPRKLQGFHGTARKRQPVRQGRPTALCRVPGMASPSRETGQGIVQA